MTRSASRPVLRVGRGRRALRSDHVAVEEPLEIRLGGRPLTVTMRTPGHDFELAAGFLHAEGIVAGAADVHSIRRCGDPSPGSRPGSADYNAVDVALGPGARMPDTERLRRFGMTSACGVCGAASIDAVLERVPPDLSGDPVAIGSDVIASLPDRMAREQAGFHRTGGLHAAAAFEADGSPLVVREDVGRHNAFDKVIGRLLLDGRLPAHGRVILASGRASFELVQKAAVAGFPILAAVSAPSSLAVDLAERTGITLVGFVRGGSMNVYTRRERVR